MLPHIFKLLQTYYDYDISFIIIGDGTERAKIFNLLNKLKIRKFLFLGNLPPNQIPDILGSINVLVLPSFNEGLPRVALEAQVCGVHVVGSDRGGIPEAIGECNCFPIDSNFSINVSKHIINLLDGLICKPTLPVQFDTNKAVLREISIIKNIVEYDLHMS
jgi:glycosyltransferase involved in cell wall biosynthesis